MTEILYYLPNPDWWNIQTNRPVPEVSWTPRAEELTEISLIL